jgi:ABC-type spermidine/putrescine transport system permease subunit I
MIQLEIEQNGNWGMAAALAVVLLVMTTVLTIIAQSISAKRR